MPTHDLTHKFLNVEGHNIAYLEAGEGPPLVRLHGIPTSSLLWRHVIPTLARGHRVIAPDMLNYGRFDQPERADVPIAAQARILGVTPIRSRNPPMQSGWPTLSPAHGWSGSPARRIGYWRRSLTKLPSGSPDSSTQ